MHIAKVLYAIALLPLLAAAEGVQVGSKKLIGVKDLRDVVRQFRTEQYQIDRFAHEFKRAGIDLNSLRGRVEAFEAAQRVPNKDQSWLYADFHGQLRTDLERAFVKAEKIYVRLLPRFEVAAPSGLACINDQIFESELRSAIVVSGYAPDPNDAYLIWGPSPSRSISLRVAGWVDVLEDDTRRTALVALDSLEGRVKAHRNRIVLTIPKFQGVVDAAAKKLADQLPQDEQSTRIVESLRARAEKDVGFSLAAEDWSLVWDQKVFNPSRVSEQEALRIAGVLRQTQLELEQSLAEAGYRGYMHSVSKLHGWPRNHWNLRASDAAMQIAKVAGDSLTAKRGAPISVSTHQESHNAWRVVGDALRSDEDYVFSPHTSEVDDFRYILESALKAAMTPVCREGEPVDKQLKKLLPATTFTLYGAAK